MKVDELTKRIGNLSPMLENMGEIRHNAPGVSVARGKNEERRERGRSNGRLVDRRIIGSAISNVR